MASPGVHHNYPRDSLASSYSSHIVEPKSPCNCSHCCQICDNRGPHQQLPSRLLCDAYHHSSSLPCACTVNPSGCVRPQHCCSSSVNSVPAHQTCSCHGSSSGYTPRQTCSCGHQQHQQSAFSPLPHVYSPYSVQRLSRNTSSGVTYAPLPLPNAYGYAQLGPSLPHNQDSFSNYSEESEDSLRNLEDNAHYHTHIHHHIHRHQHYPYSCVTVGHHHLPAMTVPSHLGASRLWRHMNSRGASSASHPYLHLPLHFHPYIPRVLPMSLAGRPPMTTFQVQSSELDPDQADVVEWNSGPGTRQSETRGLTKSEIEQLPTYVVTADSKNKSNDRCVICISDFEEKDHLRVLSCTHEFHSKCVDKWLKSNPTCPICRAVVQVNN